MINIYLDDERKTPDGYIRTYTVEETIKLIKDNDGQIDTLSLDNDLGEGFTEGRKVLDWLEEESFFNKVKPIPYIYVHSQNSVARDIMKQTLLNCRKNWERNWENNKI